MDKRIKLYFKRMLEKNKEVVIYRFIIKYLFGEDVTMIDLSKYVINKITSHCFSNFNNLELIKLGNKNLKIIEPNSFINCEKLSSIFIENSIISELKKNTFYKLPNLRYLYILNNINLQNICLGFINKCNKLHEIQLNECRISRLNKDTFSNLPNLEILTLNNNQNLHIIENGSINNCIKLKKISITHNNNLSIVESGFINNCMKLKVLFMNNNKSLSSIDKFFINDCDDLSDIILRNCNIQILHIDSFTKLFSFHVLVISNNRLLTNYLDYYFISICDKFNLLNHENNYILDNLRDDLREVRKDDMSKENKSKEYLLHLPDEPTMKNKREFNKGYLYPTHYRYCIKIFILDPDRDNYFVNFMNLLSQTDNRIIKENIFIILFIIILYLLKINIYYNENSLEDNILHLINIVNDTLSTKYLKNSLSFSENILNEVGEYLGTNKYILQYKNIIIKIIGYLIDIYKGSSKFDSIIEYLYINNMKNKRKLKKINIRKIINKKMELSYIIKEINESLELPKLKEGEIGLLLHYLKKLIDFKKMKRINNPKEIQELSEHRNIQKKN